MAEDQENRTEPATGRRREEAWDQGNFARSADLNAAFLLTVGLLVVYFMGQTIVSQLAHMMRNLLGPQYWADRQEMIDNSVRMSAGPLVWILGPVFGVMFVASAFAGAAQIGFRFKPKSMTPNLSRLNPLGGLSRLWGGQNWFQLGMNVAKLIAVASVSYARVRARLPDLLALPGLPFPTNMSAGFAIIFDLGIRIAVALLILGFLDWLYHRWKFERDIRMTKQEVKDEMKMMEGDMEMKSRRRQLGRKMIMQRIRSDVPKADVVVTNPTELAIALRYDPDTMGAPRVVAKGAGFLAATIRQIAVANGVPIIERKPLAQALYKSVEVGQEVPPQFYQTIAEILAYVYELAGKKPRVRQRVAG